MRLTVAALLLAGCAAAAGDPVMDARRLVRRAADVVRAGNEAALQRLVVEPTAAKSHTPSLAPAELATAAQALDRAANGRAQSYARARIEGPMGVRYALRRTEVGWRVDPDAVALPSPTPRAAIAHLIDALDRLETDPALVLLSGPLRDAILRNTRERARALREIAPRMSDDPSPARIPLQVDYGPGFFLLLRPELEGWRIDDFN